jgi:3-oxoacid CoA-transferase subunit A
MFYITGDTHRDFWRVGILNECKKTTANDVLLILGDAGINYAEIRMTEN